MSWSASDSDRFLFEDFSQDTDSVVMLTPKLQGTAGKVRMRNSAEKLVNENRLTDVRTGTG